MTFKRDGSTVPFPKEKPMKKFILIPDSFKGTLSSIEICEIMEKEIRKQFPDAEILSIPVADGGEGSVDAFLLAVGGDKVNVSVKGPLFEEISSFYGVIDGGKTAIIEMAAAAGLPLVADKKDPLLTTTYGVGQLMAHALENGCEKIIMGLGGSATNDGGCGAAAALGIRFLDREGKEFIPVGGTLKDIEKIDRSGIHKRLKDVSVFTMCDIDNPLYGEAGAAYIFGPQKGATPDIVAKLDKGLRHFSNVVHRDLGYDYDIIKGTGAAGGMGFGMMVFFGSSLQMGIETVLDTVSFNHLLDGTDVVFSGEGRIDSQSLRGKVVIGVAKRCKKRNIPLVAVVGQIGEGIDDAYGLGVTSIFSINTTPESFEMARPKSKKNLTTTMDNILRLIKGV